MLIANIITGKALLSALLYFISFFSYGIEINGFRFSAGFFAYTAILFIPWTKLSTSKTVFFLWCICSSIIIFQIYTLNLAANGVISEINWGRKIILAVIVGLYLTALYLCVVRKSTGDDNIIINRQYLFLLFCSIIAVIIAFQVCNQISINLDIPNEDRSTVISGLEIHHINAGIFGLLMLPMIAMFAHTKTARIVLFVITTFSYAMVIDQWYYFAMPEVTDIGYISFEVRVSIVLMMTALSFVWLLYTKTAAADSSGKQSGMA